eukprot:comp23408_c0_seq1/m.38871 comp23408_c0_seq1/g.38871  ORF comp23408_c0_seq1/g.38871 comp23408_c0_seq1/m.38871 type:complete len:331 (-) comp23408_c0_seq1:613-1605(-)
MAPNNSCSIGGNSLSPSTWMADLSNLIGGKKLQQVTLPGTHNSGSYKFTDTSFVIGQSPAITQLVEFTSTYKIPFVGNVVEGYALCQSRDIAVQMRDGMRYLDIRAAYVRGQWLTHHGYVSESIGQHLEEVAEFLKEHPGEVMIVEISHLTGHPTPPNAEAKKALADLVMAKLGDLCYPASQGFKHTISEMVSMNKRCVMVFSDGHHAYPNQIWPGDAIINTYADTANLGRMHEFNGAKAKEFTEKSSEGAYGLNRLLKISWTLTPDTDHITSNLMSSLKGSCALPANGTLANFAANMKGSGLRPGNLVIVDYYEQACDFLPTVVAFNSA